MNREELAKAHPDLLAALLAEGHSAGLLVGRAEGATTELARIRGVEAQAMAGHEDLINTLKFDGKTTGHEAAVQVLAAEKAAGTARLAALNADAPRPAVHAIPPAATAQTDDADASKPLPERAKAKWDKDPALRASFGGMFDAYLAAEKAESEGRVKVLTQKAA